MWSIILSTAKGPLIFFKKAWCTNEKKTVDLKVYIQYILPYIATFQQEYERREPGKEFIYMEDNATVHTLKLTRAAFQA